MLRRITSRIMLLAAMAAMMIVLTLSTVSPALAAKKTIPADYNNYEQDTTSGQPSLSGSRAGNFNKNGPGTATQPPGTQGEVNSCWSASPGC